MTFLGGYVPQGSQSSGEDFRRGEVVNWLQLVFFFRKPSKRIPANRTTGPEIKPKNKSGQCKILNIAPITANRTPSNINIIDSAFI